jgi:hypothetical protein
MPADTPAGSDAFERILSAPTPLVILRGREPQEVVDAFRAVARRTGQAAYLWREGEGLASLRDAQMRVPGCLRLGDVLRYILQSLHFGVYLMHLPQDRISATDLALLRQVARARTSHVRRVVLLGASDAPLSALGEDASVIDEGGPATTRAPRLRDGRWVV